MRYFRGTITMEVIDSDKSRTPSPNNPPTRQVYSSKIIISSETVNLGGNPIDILGMKLGTKLGTI